MGRGGGDGLKFSTVLTSCKRPLDSQSDPYFTVRAAQITQSIRATFSDNIKIERLRFTFTPNDKREFVPRDLVFPLIVFN